jgi:acetylornithine deacetylase/succinyl-diaminopimelate desuccinylase-like protein
MDPAKTNEFIDAEFDGKFVKPLSDFIEIPNLSPAFDQEYFSNGLIDRAIDYVLEFAASLEIEGLVPHVTKEKDVAPMVIFTYEGEGSKNVMLYGHLDKQPHMEGWKNGTGPVTPIIIDDKLFG